MDAFAVSVAVGSKLDRLSFRPVFRLSFHFGLFQFLMPILGWIVGTTVESRLGGMDHWIAFALLVIVGARMAYESAVRGPDDLADSATVEKS